MVFYLSVGASWFAIYRRVLSQAVPHGARLPRVVHNVQPVLFAVARLLGTNAAADGIVFATARDHINLNERRECDFIKLYSDSGNT